jgi:hypothetical protein
MIVARFPRLFRAAALLVVAALIGGMAETLIADMCDVDAAASASVFASVGPAPGGLFSTDGGTSQHVPQSPHTCHCIHAHVITLPSLGSVAVFPPVLSPEYISTQRAPLSVAPEPHFRPPVA